MCFATGFPDHAGERFFDLGDTLVVRLKNAEDATTTIRSIIRRDDSLYTITDSGKNSDTGLIIVNESHLVWRMHNREIMYLQLPLVSGSNWNRSQDSTIFTNTYSASISMDDPLIWKIRNVRHDSLSSCSWPKQFFYTLDYHLFITHFEFRYGLGDLVLIQEIDSVLKRK